MQKGTKLTFTVKGSHLEFRVSGTDVLVHYGDRVPFSKVTTDWIEALAWIQKLEDIEGNPHLTIIEVTELEETEAQLRRTRLDTYWSELDTEKYKRKLENLMLQERVLEQTLTELPQQRTEAQKALEDACTKHQLLQDLLGEHG